MLHGRAIIDLHNTRTHKDERIVHDNMLTNWLRDSFDMPNIYSTKNGGGSLSALGFDRAPYKIFGGLVMFDTALSNDADDYFFPKPSVAKMVAHADRRTYSGNNLKRGSFNSSQSSEAAGTITRVWDFTQEQGNGNIASLGLCYDPWGCCGSGNTYRVAVNSTEMCSAYSEKIGLVSDGLNNIPSGRYWHDVANSFVYYISMANEVLTIKKYGYPSCQFNPLRQVFRQVGNVYDDFATINLYGAISETTVDLSSVLDNSDNNMLFFMDAGKLYILSDARTENWTDGTSRTLVTLDISDGTYTTQTVTNNTGVTLSGGFSAQTNWMWAMGIDNGKMYIRGGLKVYYINLSDNTDCGEVTFSDGSSFDKGQIGASYGYFYKLGKWLMICTDTVPETQDLYNAAAEQCIIDGNKLYQIQMAGLGGAYSQGTLYSSGVYKAMQFHGLQFCPIPSLLTKNNLESAVTKTADMTMRVTYTVTDAAE